MERISFGELSFAVSMAWLIKLNTNFTVAGFATFRTAFARYGFLLQVN